MKWTMIVLVIAVCAFGQKAKPSKAGLYAVFHTEFGDFRAELFEKDTPNSVATFIGLSQGTVAWKDPDGKMVKKPLYDNTTFYRVLPGMAIQTGSPNGNLAYDCGFTIRDESLPGIRFRAGSMAIANAGPDSGSCQFFITVGPTPTWDGKYTIFGLVVDGMDVVDKINHVPVHGEEPVNPPKLLSVTLQRVGTPPVIKMPKK